MKKILIAILFMFLLTGCVNPETKKFIKYLESNNYNCVDKACSLTEGNENNLIYYNFNYDKKIFTKGYSLEKDNHIQLNYEYKKDIIWIDYNISETPIEASYNNVTDEYTCDVDKSQCDMVYDLITKEYIDINKIFTLSGVNKEKM